MTVHTRRQQEEELEAVSPFISPATMEQLESETIDPVFSQIPGPIPGQEPLPPLEFPEDVSPEGESVVQEGDTGGFLEGTGITVGEGSSTTPEEAAQFTQDALDAGLSQEEIDSFLARNPNDFSRLVSAGLSGGDRDNPLAFNTLEDDPGFVAGGGDGGAFGFDGGGGSFGSGGDLDPDTPIDTAGLMDLLNAVNQEGDRDVNLPGPGDIPVIEVPGVNLSSDIDNSILSLLRSEDATTNQTDAAIQALLESIGGRDEDRLLQRQLQATETAQLAQHGLFSQLQAQLADAGTIGLPGAPQGAETAGARRVAERVAIPFAQELRQAGIEESVLADQRELSALQLATGWSADKATRVLQAAATGTDRQRILSEIALGTLDRNIVWNQFLAQFGLDRERLLNDIQNGRFDRVTSILTQFQQLLAQLRGGFIGA